MLVPNARDRDTVHRIIYEELCLGIIAPESRVEYQRVMADLAALGAQAIILGCTEISMLIGTEGYRSADFRHDAPARTQRGRVGTGRTITGLALTQGRAE